MDTLLTPPALHSAKEAARFIDEVLAQARPLRERMQADDTEIARLTAEAQSLRTESARFQARQQQAASDIDAALARLTRSADAE